MGSRPHVNFESTHEVRIAWDGHGFTVARMTIRVVKREDGVMLGITRNEWFKMLSPLLVRNPNGEWFLGNNPVKVTFLKGEPLPTN